MTPRRATARRYPAQYAKDIEGVIAVSAVDFANSSGPRTRHVNDYVEIAAPGGDVDADLNDDGFGDGVLQQTLDFDAVSEGRFNEFGYFFLNGTSMASPHVAGDGRPADRPGHHRSEGSGGRA